MNVISAPTRETTESLAQPFWKFCPRDRKEALSRTELPCPDLELLVFRTVRYVFSSFVGSLA